MLAIVAGASGLACSRSWSHRQRDESAARAAPRALELEFAGCEGVERGPRCRLSESRRLTLWTATTAELRATTDRGATIGLSAKPVEGGTRFTLEVPLGASELRVQSKDGAASWVLPLLEPDAFPELSEAQRLRAAGDLVEARATLERYIAGPRTPEESSRLDAARGVLARISMSEGEYERAIQEYRACLRRSIEAGRISQAMRDAAGMAFVLTKMLQRHAEARAVLSEVSGFVQSDPGSRAMLLYNHGLVSLDSGDYRSALSAFRTASSAFTRLSLDEYAQFALEQRAVALAVMGRVPEAVEVQRALLRDYANPDPCSLAERQEGVVWFALQAERLPNSELDPIARQYWELADTTLVHCESPYSHRNHLLNGLDLALQFGELAHADELLTALGAVQGGQDPELDTMECEMKGRYALALGRLELARRAFECARDLGSKNGIWKGEYLAQLGLARSQRRQPERALESYREAERLLDEVLDRIPVSEGKSAFRRLGAAGSRELMELLLQLGRPAEALATARAARARVLASAARATRLEHLDPERRARWEAAVGAYMRERTRYEALQADAWRLPRDRLGELQERLRAIQQGAHAQLDAADAALGDVVAPLPDDALRFHEVLLAYFLGTSGLHAFVRSAVSTQAFALAPLSSGELSAQMIAPLANELRSASRLRVILPNELAMHDFHALELDGQPLAQRFDVVYVLDVPVREAAPTERSTRDLIVANADGTLPGSEREGRSVQDSLPAAELWNGDVAKRAKVREALPNLHRFHFAGHARYAGVDGIDSSLLLADGELSVGELLTLGSGPELVVLSACEAARGADSGPVVGLGLVQAFIAAGARSVIAAPRPTNDQASREFFELYYRALSEPGAQDLPVRAWRRASLQLFARGRPDWAAYRFFVP